MRLVIELSPSIELTEANSNGANPYLTNVGTLHLSARAGDAIGLTAKETPNITVTLDNEKRRVSRLIGAPLRARATIYDDDESIFFDGLTAVIAYGLEIALEIDA